MADATPLPLLGAKHPRADGGFLWESIVNGPVRSRRLGVSLGWGALAVADEVAHSLRGAVTRLPAAPDWITFAGNGEPTMHPRFSVVVERVVAVRAEFAPWTRVAVLSNGVAAGKPAIRDALRALDARIMKLDPGPMERVNASRHDAGSLVEAYRALKPYTIQAMVTRGTGGSAPRESAAGASRGDGPSHPRGAPAV